jgi:hypothetical protein
MQELLFRTNLFQTLTRYPFTTPLDTKGGLHVMPKHVSFLMLNASEAGVPGKSSVVVVFRI